MNDHIKLAEDFLLSSIKRGLAHSYDVETESWVKPYPEVTGYLLQYFSKYAQDIPHPIINSANYLCKLQHKTGGFSSFNTKHVLFTFDTAQIMYGLLYLYKRTQNKLFLEVAEKCAMFITDMQIENGAMFPIYNTKLNARYVDKEGGWGRNFSYIQVKNIEGLLSLYKITKEIKYKESALKLRDYGKKYCDSTFTHPCAYCLEGMLTIGEKKFVRKVLKEQVIPRIQNNGFLSYSEGLSYSYVSGSVQIGILLSNTGFKEEAYSILEWARKVQSKHSCGGLFQYAHYDGSLNQDIHTEINTWGTKYYAELERLFL